MDNIRIKTNRQWRQFLYGYELTEKQAADFDYIDSEDFPTHNFIKYKGMIYDYGEFMTCSTLPRDNPLTDWHGHHSDSFFSGVVIRTSSDGEMYQIGTFYA